MLHLIRVEVPEKYIDGSTNRIRGLRVCAGGEMDLTYLHVDLVFPDATSTLKQHRDWGLELAKTGNCE